MRRWLPLFALCASCAASSEHSADDARGDAGDAAIAMDVGAPDTHVGDVAPLDAAPKPLPPTAAVQVSVGYVHTCARTVDGHVRCWGSSAHGELGPDALDTFGSGAAAFDPTPALPALPAVKQVLAGHYLSCAVAIDGALWCWGHGRRGLLADGVMPAVVRSIATPELVAGAGRVKLITGGGDYFAAIGEDQLVRTWGYNIVGQLGYVPTTPCGDGSESNCSATPTALSLGDVRQLAGGADHACIVRSTGTVACWGHNEYGDLGDGTTVTRADAKDVVGIIDAVAIATGYHRSCVLRAGNKVSCWGPQPTAPASFAKLTAPIAIAGIAGTVRQLTVGGAAACVLLESKRVQCWGSNSRGELGNPAAGAFSHSAVAVVDLDDVVDVSAGASRVCAVKGDGTLWCWGDRLRAGGWDFDLVPTKVNW